jgi:hypothetical protein
MKKNEKKCVLQFEKTYFLYCFFGLVPWICISKVISTAREGAPITF